MVSARLIVFATALALTLLGDAWGQTRRPAPRTPAQPSAQSTPPATPPAAPDQRGTDQSPLSVKILPDPDAGEKEEKEEQDHQRRAQFEAKLALETERIAEYTRWLAAFALGLLFVALGQIALFGVQLRHLRRSAQDAADTTKAAAESARAATAQAGIARDSLKAMQNTAERQSRAYVEVEIEKLDLNAANTGVAEVVLRVRNVGRTPARDLVCNSWVELRPWPQPPNAAFTGPADPNQSKAIVNPGQARHFKTATKAPLKAFELEEIAAGTPRRLYVFGSVTYRDVFRNDLVTEFCVAIKAAPGLPFEGAYSPQHNNAT